MKKIPLNLISLGLLIVSVLILHGVHGVYAQDDQTDADIQEACDGYNFNNSQLFEDLADAVGVNTDIDIVNIFKGILGQSETPKVKDLYLGIYKKVKSEPEGEALKATAEQYQFTETQMCAVLGGSLAPIASMVEGENVTATDAIEILNEIKTAYETNLTDAKRKQDMFLDSYTREVFANGDTGDSSFDVLYDLEILEYLLFGESGYATEIGDQEDPMNFTGPTPSDGINPAGTSTSTDTKATPSEETPVAEESPPPETPPAIAEEPEPVAPASCNADSGLQTAFLAAVPEPVPASEPSTSETDTGLDTGISSQTPSNGTTPTTEESTPGTIVSAAPNDWSSPEVCDSVFCLIIKFTNRPDPSYTKTDNCIKCHVEYVAKALEDTLSQSLTLGKVSGNLMEPPVCKNDLLLSVTQVDLNLFLIPMPILTPPGDDIVQGLSFCDSIKDFMKAKDPYELSLQNLFDGDEGSGGVCGADPDTLANKKLTDEEIAKLRHYGEGLNDALKDATTRSGTTTSVNDLYTQALNDYTTHMAEFDQAFSDSYIVARAGSQNELYQDLGIEMDQMTNYFKDFYESISLTLTVAKNLQTKLKTPQ